MDTALSTETPIVQNQQSQDNQVNLANQEGATVQGGTTTVPKSNAPKSSKGTGYTNVQQYVQANKGAAQQIANAASSKIKNQSNAIAQQVEKAQKGFNTQAQQATDRINQAQQFGNQAINKATNVYDVNDLNKQQQELNKRISQTTAPEQDYTADIATSQSNLQNLQAQKAQAEAGRNSLLQSIQEQQNLADYYKKAADSPVFKRSASGAVRYETNTEAQNQYQQAMNNIASMSAQQASVDQPYNQINSDIDAANQQLEKLQFNKRLQDRQAVLKQELASLQDKIANNQALTDDEVNRFRNIVEEKEVFDNIMYNDQGAEAKANALKELTGTVGSEAGRRQLLRDTFTQGNQQYTRGQTALDQLLLQSDLPVAEQFINQTKKLGVDTQKQTQDARRAAMQELGRVSTAASNLRSGLKTGVSDAQTALTDLASNNALSGSGSYLGKLKQAYEQGLLSEDQANALGLQQGQTYGVDIGSKLADYQNLATAESSSSLSDLARADALARLAGQSEQTIFANRDRVGQMSEAEKQRLAEVQGSIYDAQKEYERRKNLEQGSMSDAISYSGDQRATGAQDVVQVSNRNNSQRIIDAINAGLADSDLSRDDLLAIMNSAPSGQANYWANGIGDFGSYLGANQNLVNLENQNLLNRIQVEGSTDALTAKQRQDALNDLAQKSNIYQALAKATVNTGGIGGLQKNTQAANQAEYNRLSALQAASKTNNANPNSVNPNAMNLIEAYNRITGRNFNPNV